MPSHSEISSYVSLPSSLSMGNNDTLAQIVNLRGYNNKWTEYEGVYWTIPHDHPVNTFNL